MRWLIIILLSCSYAWAEGYRAGTMSHPPIDESSGIVASRTHAGVFWTHNDSGNPPALFAIARDGSLLAEYSLIAINVDWEDIAADDAGHLFLADTGNNRRHRTAIRILQIDEPRTLPEKPDRGGRLGVSAQWTVSYAADGPFDCESFFVHEKFGYLISKHTDFTPAGLYRFPMDRPGAEGLTLERVATLPLRIPVTAADLARDGRQLAVATPAGPCLLELDGPLADPLRCTVQRIAMLTPDMEALCFAGEELLGTTESRQVLAFPLEDVRRKAMASPPAVLRLELGRIERRPVIDGDLSEWPAGDALTLQATHSADEKRSKPSHVWCRWSPEGLYFAGSVVDSDLKPLSESWFAGDCVEIFIGREFENRPPEYTEQDTRCYLGFSASRDGAPDELQVRWPMQGNASREATQAAGKITDFGWEFELFLPAGVLGLEELSADALLRLECSMVSRTPKLEWYLSTPNSKQTWTSPWLWAVAKLR